MSDTYAGNRYVHAMLLLIRARGWGINTIEASTGSATTGQVDDAGREVAIDVRRKREVVRWIKKHVG